MANRNGLLAPTATHGALSPSYYLTKADLIAPTLVSAVDIESADRTASAQISVVGLEGTPAALTVYSGSIGLRPGTSSLGAAPAGVNIRSIENGVAVEVGTDGVGIVNTLGVAGADGVAQVYDEIYNQPVQLQPITVTSKSATNIADPANPSEIFRCVQAGVAASVPAAIGCVVQVPRTGFYMVAIEIALANAPAPAAISITTPIDNVSGFNIGETLQFSFTGPGSATTVTPYGNLDVGANELAQSQNLVANDGVTRQYTFMQLFNAGTTYRFLFKASSPNWNIGAAGQIKAELIAMC
jgi:hypothetical protein